MSRRAHFARALASGYGAMAVNIIYTLASVPLALAYLDRREFGLWAVVAQVAGYLALIDCGLSGSISRLLIDAKDDRERSTYGTVVKTAAVVTMLQGFVALLLGLMAAPFLPGLMKVPVDLAGDFVWLVVIQCALFGLGLGLKIFQHLLTAHQRYDFANYAQALSFIAMFAVQWTAFRGGAGIYSLAWASAAGALAANGVAIAGCFAARVFPARGAGGRFSGPAFRQIFSFGAELFLQVLGWQLLAATQVVIIARFLGLEAAAAYTACTKTFALAQQAVWRVFDQSIAALSEMAVRAEPVRLRDRFCDLVVVSGSLAVVVGTVVAACNQSFVTLWTKGEIGWAPHHDWLLGGLLVAYTLNRVHGGLAWVSKAVRELRYVYFFEGLLFFVVAAVVARGSGVAGVLVVSIAADFVVSGVYGLRHSARTLGLGWAELAGRTLRPVLILASVVGPVGWGIWILLRGLAPFPQLVANGVLIGLAGAAAMWTIGLTPALRAELRGVLAARRLASMP